MIKTLIAFLLSVSVYAQEYPLDIPYYPESHVPNLYIAPDPISLAPSSYTEEELLSLLYGLRYLIQVPEDNITLTEVLIYANLIAAFIQGHYPNKKVPKTLTEEMSWIGTKIGERARKINRSNGTRLYMIELDGGKPFFIFKTTDPDLAILNEAIVHGSTLVISTFFSNLVDAEAHVGRGYFSIETIKVFPMDKPAWINKNAPRATIMKGLNTAVRKTAIAIK